MTLMVRLSPKASFDKVEGVVVIGDERLLRAKVRAVPEKGKANAALIALIAAWLGVPKSTVSIGRGKTGRVKAVSVAGDGDALGASIRALLEPAQ